jgi:prophage maintenance system killer protein
MKEKKKFQPLTSKNVCLIYERLHNKGLVSFPLAGESKGKVEALVSNITGMFFNTEIYPTISEKIVAYLYFIIKDHPFIDGNKRTASIAFEVLCSINNLDPNYDESSLDELAVYLESTKGDHQQVIRDVAGEIFGK